MHSSDMNSRLPIGILLAAGDSRRFGSNKLLHPVVDNKPMLMVAAEKLASVLPGAIVVINDALVSYSAQLQQAGLQPVVNLDAGQGMGNSLACAIRASEQHGGGNMADNSTWDNSSGWLIMLADMPYIQVETIQCVADKLAHSSGTGSSIIAPSYKQQRGHPVGFGHAYKHELLSLQGDTGARHIIASYRQNLQLVPVDDPGVITDVDYIDDLIATA